MTQNTFGRSGRLGNGHLGAMVFGGITEERLQLNENTLYSDEPRRRDLPLDVT